jgi:hypothetical protein
MPKTPGILLSHFGRVKTPAFQATASAFLFLYLRQLRCLWQYVVITAFIRDFLIGEADIARFSCYSKPPASADGAFTLAAIYGTEYLTMQSFQKSAALRIPMSWMYLAIPIGCSIMVFYVADLLLRMLPCKDGGEEKA